MKYPLCNMSVKKHVIYAHPTDYTVRHVDLYNVNHWCIFSFGHDNTISLLLKAVCIYAYGHTIALFGILHKNGKFNDSVYKDLTKATNVNTITRRTSRLSPEIAVFCHPLLILE